MVSFSSRKAKAHALIALILWMLLDELLDALHVADVDEAPADDRPGLWLVHRVEITVNDPLGELILRIKRGTGLVPLFGKFVQK